MVYYRHVVDLGVNLISLEEFQASDFAFQCPISSPHSTHRPPFFSASMLMPYAPPTRPAPQRRVRLGLTADEFCALATTAGKSTNTKIIEFTETNPNFDIDNRTTKLVATQCTDLSVAQNEKASE
jgi:formiminoglutamase